MDRYIAELERDLLRGERLDLARGALVASGVATQQALDRCLGTVDLLRRAMADTLCIRSGAVDKARAIFDWLWREKPDRYKTQGRFRLTDVLDAQAGAGETVGNCLGLTVLYNVLAQQFGLEARAAHMESAFGRGPHVFSVIDVGNYTIDIENILSDGFDYRAHSRAVDRIAWGNRELIADIYHSVGNELAASGEWGKAVDSYEKSLALNPQYDRARLNMGIALMEMGRLSEAEEWFRSAVQP